MDLALRAVALTLIAAAFTPVAQASMSAALDLEALVDASDHVVLAEAVWATPRWDGDERIVTDVRLVVEDAMKGPLRPGDETLLTLLGGVVGDIGMRVTGEAQLAVGARAIVFGEERPRAGMPRMRPVGMAQGVLPVVREAGSDVVEPGGRGLQLMGRGPDGLLHPTTGALSSRRPLDEVRSAILHRVEATR